MCPPIKSSESQQHVHDSSFEELAGSTARVAQLFVRLIFRERSVGTALEKPELLSVKMLSTYGRVHNRRDLLRLDEELAEESREFVLPPLWLAWFDKVHPESVERLKREIRELPEEAGEWDWDGAIYISYAREDAEIARYVAEQLKMAGLKVWIDIDGLRGGDNWRELMTTLISQRCGVFLSLISKNSGGREGSFTFERHLAAERLLRFGTGHRFYMPLRIDSGDPWIPENEPPIVRDLHVQIAEEGRLSNKFIEELAELQKAYRRASSRPV